MVAYLAGQAAAALMSLALQTQAVVAAAGLVLAHLAALVALAL
jgi:hypothetical protein